MKTSLSKSAREKQHLNQRAVLDNIILKT